MINYKLITMAILFSLFSYQVYADQEYVEDRKVLALWYCLHDNQKALGTYYDDPNIREYVVWSLPIGKDGGHFSLDGTISLTEYVEKMTGDFYKNDYSGYYNTEDYQGKISHVFIDCYKFHQSPELDAFLKSTPP